MPRVPPWRKAAASGAPDGTAALVWLPCQVTDGAGSPGDPYKAPNLGTCGAACDAFLGVDGETPASNHPALQSPDGYDYDGGDLLTVPDNDNLSFGNGAGTDQPFSLEATVIADTDGASQLIAKDGVSWETNREWYLNLSSDGKFYFILLGYSSGNYLGVKSGVLTIQARYHVVGTYDGSKTQGGMNMYVNGVLDNNNHTGGAYPGMENTAQAVKIGSGATGIIKNPRIWDYELTQPDVTDLYRAS